MAYVVVKGIEELSKRLREFDQRDLLRTTLRLMENQTRQRILDGGPGPDGRQWPAWSTRYAATRHANQSLLMASGELLRRVSSRIGADGYGYLGTGVIYGRRHQYGDAALGFTPIRGGKIPARPFLGMSTEDFNEIRAALLKKLVKQVGG